MQSDCGEWSYCSEQQFKERSGSLQKAKLHSCSDMTDTYTALAPTLFIAEEQPHYVSQNIYLNLYFTPLAASSTYLGKQCKNRESKQVHMDTFSQGLPKPQRTVLCLMFPMDKWRKYNGHACALQHLLNNYGMLLLCLLISG